MQMKHNEYGYELNMKDEIKHIWMGNNNNKIEKKKKKIIENSRRTILNEKRKKKGIKLNHISLTQTAIKKTNEMK